VLCRLEIMRFIPVCQTFAIGVRRIPQHPFSAELCAYALFLKACVILIEDLLPGRCTGEPGSAKVNRIPSPTNFLALHFKSPFPVKAKLA